MTIQPLNLQLSMPNALSGYVSLANRSSSSGSLAQVNERIVNSATVKPAKQSSIHSNTASRQIISGNSNQSATGSSAATKVHNLIADDNQLKYNEGLGSFTFNSEKAHAGMADTVKALSQSRQSKWRSAHEDGATQVNDAARKTNGPTNTGARNRFVVSHENGNYQVKFATGIQDKFVSTVVPLRTADSKLQDGDSQGTSQGTDVAATVPDRVQQANSSSLARTAVPRDLPQFNSIDDGLNGHISPITVSAIEQNSAPIPPASEHAADVRPNETATTHSSSSSHRTDVTNRPIQSTNPADNLITQIVVGTASAMHLIANAKLVATPAGTAATAYQETMRVSRIQTNQTLVWQQFDQQTSLSDNVQSRVRFATRADEEDPTNTSTGRRSSENSQANSDSKDFVVLESKATKSANSTPAVSYLG